MGVIRITDLEAPEAGLFYHLTDAQLRSRQEPEKGIFISEGPKVTHAALDAGCEPVSLLLREKFVSSPAGQALMDRCAGEPVYTGPDEALCRLTGFRLQRSWVLCAMRRPRPLPLRDVIRGKKRAAFLEGIGEPSNVGAIFRSAAALGADAVLLSPDCCDPLHRRAVRVCMGAVFQVPWARLAGPGDWALIREEGFTVLGMALRDGCLSLDDPTLPGTDRLLICLGTEDTGLTEDTLARCDRIVKIPMAPGIDSLNVAAASAVAFWQLRNRPRADAEAPAEGFASAFED